MHDAKSKLFVPVGLERIIAEQPNAGALGDVLIATDSLLRVGADGSWVQSLVVDAVRKEGGRTVQILQKGGMRAMEMADQVLAATQKRAAPFDVFVGSLQVNDVAWVDSSGKRHVWSVSEDFKRTRGEYDVALRALATTIRRCCRKAVVVVTDCIYAAYAEDVELRQKYAAAVEFTRQTLMSAGVAILHGEELQGLGLCDGVHFEIDAAWHLARACAKWATRATPPETVEPAAAEPRPTLPNGWKEAQREDGAVYYFNVVTWESVWQIPGH